VCLQNTNDNNINNNVGIKESKSQTPILPIDRITAGDCKYIFHLFFKTKKKGKIEMMRVEKVSTFFLILILALAVGYGIPRDVQVKYKRVTASARVSLYETHPNNKMLNIKIVYSPILK
jgi:hypothetical protein